MVSGSNPASICLPDQIVCRPSLILFFRRLDGDDFIHDGPLLIQAQISALEEIAGRAISRTQLRHLSPLGQRRLYRFFREVKPWLLWIVPLCGCVGYEQRILESLYRTEARVEFLLVPSVFRRSDGSGKGPQAQKNGLTGVLRPHFVPRNARCYGCAVVGQKRRVVKEGQSRARTVRTAPGCAAAA